MFYSVCFGCVDNAHTKRTYCYDIELKLERQHDCVQRFGYETTHGIIGGGDAGHGVRGDDERLAFAIAAVATTSILISLMTSDGHMFLAEKFDEKTNAKYIPSWMLPSGVRSVCASTCARASNTSNK